MKIIRNVRILAAELLLGMALKIVPGGSREAVQMARCIDDYIRSVFHEDPNG